MDGNRFDELTRRLASGSSRRSFLKRSLATLAGSIGIGAATGVDAARPTPTPAPLRCPGRQTPCGSQCCCPAGTTKCAAECCSSTAQCCDGACCNGQCFGEELCCPTGRIVCNGACLQRGQCCTDANCQSGWKCGIETPHVCTCVPQYDCESFELECGAFEDECGNIDNCGSCPEPGICGAAGQENRCGCANGGILCEGACLEPGQCCTDRDCFAIASGKCGAVEPHVCTCVPPDDLCEQAGFDCGILIDPCGNQLDCGACSAPLACGTGDRINTCICPSDHIECNGHCLEFGQCCTDTDCPPSYKCGIETPNECTCVSQYSCADLDLECGIFVDGCGIEQNCGTCDPPGICGGAGQDNRCGCANGGILCEDACLEPGQCCTDRDCFDTASGKCGAVEPHICTCVPPDDLCQQAGFNCGILIDPCGNELNCGTCTPPQICGTGDQINTCV